MGVARHARSEDGRKERQRVVHDLSDGYRGKIGQRRVDGGGDVLRIGHAVGQNLPFLFRRKHVEVDADPFAFRVIRIVHITKVVESRVELGVGLDGGGAR